MSTTLTAEEIKAITVLIGRAETKGADAPMVMQLFTKLQTMYDEAMNGDDADASEQGPEGPEAVRPTD